MKSSTQSLERAQAVPYHEPGFDSQADDLLSVTKSCRDSAVHWIAHTQHCFFQGSDCDLPAEWVENLDCVSHSSGALYVWDCSKAINSKKEMRLEDYTGFFSFRDKLWCEIDYTLSFSLRTRKSKLQTSELRETENHIRHTQCDDEERQPPSPSMSIFQNHCEEKSTIYEGYGWG